MTRKPKVSPKTFVVKEVWRHVHALHNLLQPKEDLKLVDIAKIREYFIYILERCDVVLKSQGAIDKRYEVVDLKVIERKAKIVPKPKWWEWRKRRKLKMVKLEECNYCGEETEEGNGQCDECWEVTHRLDNFIAQSTNAREFVREKLTSVMKVQKA